ncbi:hypothetical protein FKW77_001242 [Venturia effusa]|uniref:Major facilitator superfamily (MFS) profile domain-containing protein n=1 Tax=Venturia effusa TaxID=50376 RepID=A0A517KZ10_9PEZI|nr:hypothetical protein FKW77_001242 [Venturia effusa]
MGVITLRGKPLYLLMKIICGTSFMMYGYDAGVLGGVLLHKPFLDAIDNPEGEYIIPMISSSYSLAACVTALLVGTFAFRIGRRGTVILGCVAAIIGSVIQSSSYSVAQLIVGRICTGFAIGCISSAVPTYLTETGMEIGDRGPANALNAALLISGVPLAYWIDYGFTKMDNQSDIALSQLNDLPVDSEKVQQIRRDIMLAIEMELEADSSLNWKQFLALGVVDKTELKIVRRIMICFWLPMIREWMGSSLMAYYSSVILSGVGARPSLVSLLSGILNTIYALGCYPLYFTIERVGRRAVLMYGAMIMSLLLLIFTVLQGMSPAPSTQWASIAIIFLFLFVFGYAWQGCVWLYCSEIAPLEYRHIGGAATAFGEWLMTFITVFAGPIGLTNIGWKFWIWVLSGNVVAIFFVFFLCPETGGKTLEQVDYLFGHGARAWRDIDFRDAVETWGDKSAVIHKEESRIG